MEKKKRKKKKDGCTGCSHCGHFKPNVGFEHLINDHEYWGHTHRFLSVLSFM